MTLRHRMVSPRDPVNLRRLGRDRDPVQAGFPESLIAQLRLDEQRVADLKGKLGERTRDRPKTLPHPRIIEGYLRNVLAILEGTGSVPAWS